MLFKLYIHEILILKSMVSPYIIILILSAPVFLPPTFLLSVQACWSSVHLFLLFRKATEKYNDHFLFSDLLIFACNFVISFLLSLGTFRGDVLEHGANTEIIFIHFHVFLAQW